MPKVNKNEKRSLLFEFKRCKTFAENYSMNLISSRFALLCYFRRSKDKSHLPKRCFSYIFTYMSWTTLYLTLASWSSRKGLTLTCLYCSVRLWFDLKYKKLNLMLYPQTKGVKRGVYKVYLALKYLGTITTMYTLQSLHSVQPMSAGEWLHSTSTGQPELSSPH